MIRTMGISIIRSGHSLNHDTIGISCAWVNEKLEEIKSFTIKALRPSTEIEESVLYEDWNNNKEFMKQYETEDPDTGKTDEERSLINTFVTCNKAILKKFLEEDVDVYICSNDKTYDATYINQLIFKYVEYMCRPYPYNLHTNRYDKLYDVTDMMRGILLLHNPKCLHMGTDECWDELRNLYNIPEPTEKSDRLIDYDAYMAAYRMMVLLKINKKQIKRRRKSRTPKK